MMGELVHEYTAEEVSRMTVEEIYAAICRDLRVNAYETQAATGALYRGKALAEGLQYAAYLCPHCLRFGTVETRGNRLSCSCGLTARCLETGWFEKGNYMPFDNFAEWNRFQKRWVHEHSAELRQQNDDPIVHDDGCFKLTLKKDGVFTHLSENASVAMYGDRLELSYGGRRDVFRIEDITGYGTFLSRSMYFNCGPSVRYQLISVRPVSTLKYYALWRGLSGREYL